MKRIFQLALVLLLAMMFVLPATAIINADGSDPDWDGYEGIMPAMDEITPYDIPSNDDYLGYIEVDEHFEAPERNPLARDNYVDIETISIETDTIGMINTMAIATWAALGMAALALLLAIIALVKAGRKKSGTRTKNDFF